MGPGTDHLINIHLQPVMSGQVMGLTDPGRYASTACPLHSLRSRVGRVTRVFGNGLHVPMAGHGVWPQLDNQETKMTDTPNTNRPTHAIYQVIGEEDVARWIRVGSAWTHRKDGKGMNLVFDSYPLVGRVVIREIDYSKDSQAA